MKFIADLHIHSRYSRATAKSLDFEHLYMAARQKGITVVATGDFTHPGWMAEIREKLEPAEPGLLKLKPELETACEKQISVAGYAPVRFMLSTEISNIYKKAGATRKLHHLVFFSDLAHVEKFNARLSDIGNLKSDGRPILGLDSKHLLEIVLETHESGFLIPAHIWTPWFSLFGSKSGFDTVAECFDELSDHIFAVETGLSSDPPMNWRVKDLDGRTLVSNSDAHSPANLGREANLFNTALSYGAIRSALETGDPEQFHGTLEFFPEEGKYHQDGHRKCGINLHPKDTIANDGICPECGAPMTLGVLYRVEELAGREEGEKPAHTHPFHSLIPLAEILSELLKVGPKSKKVANAYHTLISQVGPELRILHDMPISEIEASGNGLLAEAISRMRKGEVYLQAGYDGEYGRVTIFSPEERDKFAGQQALFDMQATAPAQKPKTQKAKPASKKRKSSKKTEVSAGAADESRAAGENPILAGLNEAQYRAVTHGKGPLLIVAGPGTGKTRTLICRVAHLIATGAAAHDQILAVTFTNKAAREMQDRLSSMLGKDAPLPIAATFHAFCFSLLKEIEAGHDYAIVDEEDRKALIAEALAQTKAEGQSGTMRTDTLLDWVVAAKQKILSPEDDLREIAGDDAGALAAVYGAYQQLLEIEHLYDYEDLIYRMVMHLEADPARCDALRNRFTHIFIDEYQDLNYAQYRLVRLMVPPDGNICVIGDPDQSIYGFRGSDPAYFQRFVDDYPGAEAVQLEQSYRSTETILAAANQLIAGYRIGGDAGRVFSNISGTPRIHLLAAESERGEAVAIGKTIEQMVGGMGFDFHDFDKAGPESENKGAERSFADFAVLYRTRMQGAVLAEVFEQARIPYQRANKTDAWGISGIAEPLSAMKIIEGCGAYTDLDRVFELLAPELSRKDRDVLRAWGRKNGLSLNGLMAESQRLGVDGLSWAGTGQLTHFMEQIYALGEKIAGLKVLQKIEAVFEALAPLLPEPDARQREVFSDLKTMAAVFDDDTFGFMETLALQSDPDFFRPEAEKVSLLTLHAAKGLEFPVVFVAGCEDGLIPYAGSVRQSVDMAEERRLFYVAVTRAKAELFLTSAKSRRVYGKTEKQAPSPFISDIAEELKKTVTDDNYRKKPKQVQLTLFSDD